MAARPSPTYKETPDLRHSRRCFLRSLTGTGTVIAGVQPSLGFGDRAVPITEHLKQASVIDALRAEVERLTRGGKRQAAPFSKLHLRS